MTMIPRPEFPRPNRQRSHWLNLNGSWDFALFPKGHEEAEKAFAASRCDYNRTITVPFSWVSPLSGVTENTPGIGWYRRTVSYPAGGGKMFLCFGAVDYLCDVYINGAFAGHHQGGYTTFELDVTDLWKDGENLIEVRAEDYQEETQTYGKQGYGEIQGIWQTVWLENRPQAYIDTFRFVTKCCGCVSLTANVSAPDGAVLSAEFDGQTWSAEAKDGKVSLQFKLDHPRLWSPDEPNLYEGALTLTCYGQTDRVETYFGVREVSTGHVDSRGYRWILLNGKPLYINGTLDQAFNPKGHFTYPTDEDMYAEAWRLKRLGLNMVRIHIKPEEPRKLYWMDKLGVLVMADVPCFWGEPNETARAAYEHEWPDILERDINNPSIFSWIVFNETWGLKHFNSEEAVAQGAPKWEYRKETQEWVRSVYQRAKAYDPTRLVEDNSVCNYDHVETDINTWHFYLNGYEVVRDHIRKVVNETYPGSEFNYIGGNKQTDAPLMNSECGLVWGVDESAGDSDLAWQYRYMLNEYRLHEKICGFIFTEFHDVVNEFNGYYRIDDTDKDWGYQDFCRGMTLRDLHAQDFLALDCAPCQTVKGGETVSVPMVLSSFSDAHHQEGLTVEWELWHDGLDGRVCDARGSVDVPAYGFGTTSLGHLNVAMPKENAVAILSFYVKTKCGCTISRNFTTFDVQAPLCCCQLDIPVDGGKVSGFDPAWTAMGGKKLSLGGNGEVSYDVKLPENWTVNGLTLFAEAGSKRVLQKDRKITDKENVAHGFMRGYLVDRGSFKNSYFMTDEEVFVTEADVLIDGEKIAQLTLNNDWSDSRGVLSWHAQPNDRLLDEAGSYGQEIRLEIPSRLIPALVQKGGFTLTFQVRGNGGLALYGRDCGRYAHGLLLRVW